MAVTTSRRLLALVALASAVVMVGLVVPKVNYAQTRSLTAISVTPAAPTIGVGQTEAFSGQGTFTDGSAGVLSAGAGIWAPSGSLATPRFYHTATLLQDGTVLVAGGYNGSSTFATAERYFPASGVWVSAGSMATARLSHSATLLPSGKVLVAGGIRYPDNTLFRSTELYDPLTNSWTTGPPLTFGARSSHSAILLGTGKVLVVAGLQSYPDCTYRATAELYDPAANIWTATGSLHLARSSATTTLLANGKVLMAAGPANGCPTPNSGMNQAEVYDPASATWSVTGTLSQPRYNNTITLLPGGTVLLAGGYSVGGLTASADLYNPTTGTFSLTGSLAAARATTGGAGDNGDAPLLHSGQVLFAAGSNISGTALGIAELFDPASGTWTTTGSLATPRMFNTATALNDGRVLVAGGLGNGNATLGSAELYIPKVTWTSSNGSVATIDQSGVATALSVGTTTIRVTSGSISGTTILTVAADTEPPTTNASFAAPNSNGWNRFDVVVDLDAFDSGGAVLPSGVQSITYASSGAQTGGGTFNTSHTSFTISNEGTTTVTYYATDNRGNVEVGHSFTIHLDKTPPTLFALSNLTVSATSGGGAVVSFNPVTMDSLSGVYTALVTQGLPSGSMFPHGTTSEQVTVTDKAGNSTAQIFSVTVDKALVSIDVSPSTATLTAGQGNQQFSATETFTDGSTQVLSSAGGTWAPSGSLATPRFYHTATRLQDGTVLVVGGYNASNTFASAERYYPASGLWVPAGSMATARLSHSATLLPNGKVLVAGGIRYPDNTQFNTTELYDPVTNSWSAGPPLTLGVRSSHSAVLLGNGKVLVAAGLRSYPDCTYRASAELYDPLANTWTATGSLSLARSAATTTLLANGKVLLAAGPANNCPTPNNGLNEAEVYDPATGTWAVTGTLSLPRYSNAITLLPNGKVLLAGGISGGAIASADLYDPTTGTFSLTGSLATARTASVGVGDNGVTPLLHNGQVLFAAGSSISNILGSAELYDTASGAWTTTGALTTPRTYNTATLLENGKVLVVGGFGIGSVPLGSAELYAPPGLFWASSNRSVATIEQNGLAAGVGSGTTTITATSGTISGSANLTVDRTAPTTMATPSAAPNGAGWNNTDVTVTLHATDDTGGTGVQSIVYALNGVQNGGPFNIFGDSAFATLSVEGTTTLNYHAVDNGGNVESDHALSIRIDKTPPTVFFPLQGVQANATSSAGAAVSFSVSASDSLSGLVGGTTISTMFNGLPVVPALVSGMTFPVGTTTEIVTATDAAGNIGRVSFNVVVSPFDSTPPTTNANFPAPNVNGWNRFNVNVNLNAFDSGGNASPSGVQSITYSLAGAQLGGGTFNSSNTSFTISSEGTTTVTYHATDNAGNVEADHTLTINLDKTPPSAASLPNLTVQATSSAGAVVFFNPAPSDALSGVSGVSITQGLASGSTFPHGTTNESLTVTDRAGNTTTRNFNVTVNKTLLSIAVSPAAASIVVGHDQSFQATGHFTSGSDQILPTSSGSGSGGGGGGQAWQIQFPLAEMLNLSACGFSGGGFTSQPFSATSGSGQSMFGAVSTSWGNPAIVQVGGSVTAEDVHLTLSCIPSNGATGAIDASWTGTRFEGTWQFSGASGHTTILGWSTKAPLSAPRFSHGAAAVNGLVYAIGGGNPNLPSPVEAYSPATNSWSTVSQLPVPSEGPGVVALGGVIYVAGGHVSGGNPSGVLQAYNPANGTWSTGLASMPTVRAYPALVAAGGKLYAIGGSMGTGSSSPTAVVEQYDPVTNQWTTRAPMSTPRTFHVAGALNNDTIIIAAAGGTSSTELYDVASNTWTAGPAMVSTFGNPAAAVVNNALFVFGSGGVQMFRPAGTQPTGWAGLAPMPTSRGLLGVAAVGDVVYAVGGMLSGGGGATSTVEAFSTPLPSNFQVSSGSGGGGSSSSLPLVSWQSANPSIAGINGSGFASGFGAGQTSIIATAAGVSCATTNTCATLTVTEPGHLTFTLAPGSAVFASVEVFIIDPATGDVVDGPFDVPMGETQSINDESAFRIRLTAPAGYTVTPATVDLTVRSGDNVVIPVLFALIDTTPPTLTVPSNQTAEASSSAGAIITFPNATATDSGSGVHSVSCDRSSGATFALGTTTVHCSATDNNGNTASGSFTLTVEDTTRPTLTLPANIVVDAASPAGVIVSYAKSATDTVSGAVTVNCVPSSGSIFPIGTTTVGCTATDGSGNTASGSFQVLVQAAAAQVANLVTLVQNFNLVQNISNSLDAKLQNILSALGAAQTGSVANVCGQLNAFVNETQAQSGKKLTVAQANQLIVAATRIEAVVGCQ